MNWNNNQYLKWGITLILAIVGTYCMLKSYGYCNEVETYYDYCIDEEEAPSYESVPVEQEYLYQYGARPVLAKSAKWVNPYEHKWDNPVYAKGKGNANQRQQWQDEYDNHHFNAVRTYNDAYNRVWWLPNLTMRQLGRDAWIAACATAGTKTVCSALVVAFSTMLSQYGLHCLDEWDYIEDKLYWSDYHFKQCAYYAKLLHG